MILFIIEIDFLVVNNVFCFIFIFVLSSSHIINNVHRPSRVALFYSIGCLWNDMYVFESFLSVHHLVANYAKNVDERGQNLMCVRTLPSLLVEFVLKQFSIDFGQNNLGFLLVQNSWDNFIGEYLLQI